MHPSLQGIPPLICRLWLAGLILSGPLSLAISAAEATALLAGPAAAQRFTAPEGFRVSLFAGEPDVLQPVGMNFDDRGRLWVAECHTYADLRTNFDLTLRDRIVMFEDARNEGRFQRRKVFWDQAQRLTSVAPGFGGVFALCAPHLVFLPDRDRDDVPDGPPEVLLDGWDAGPVRHNIVNGLRWGPDGWLYGRHGIQATSAVGPPGTPESARTRLNCAIWRYHPTRRRFEVVCQGGTNPWGHDWDEHGELFFINTVIGHLWHGIPGAHFKRMYGEHLRPYLYELIDQHADHYHWDTGRSWTDSRNAAGKSEALGGGHAHSGLMIYLGDDWPARYHNGLFTLNFHGRRINHDRLERHGAGYVGRHQADVLKFEDPWFRGIDLAYGPDGGVFVLDWSDTGECHENDADGVHRETGRVFKITYGEGRFTSVRDVSRASDAELVKLQLHANEWFARHARRVLQERAAAGADLTETRRQLRAVFEEQPLASRKLRAMWALHLIGGADERWLRTQLEHPDEHVRAWAVRLLTDERTPSPEVLAGLVRRAGEEPSGLVRLYLASSLRRFEPAQRMALGRALLDRTEDARDPNLPLLIWYGLEPAVTSQPDQAIALVEAARIPRVRQFIARRLTEDLDKSPQPVNALLELAARCASPELQFDICQGMTEALRGWRKAPRPAAWEPLRARLEDTPHPALRERVRELALVFGDGRALDEIKRLACDSRADGEVRRAALRQLIAARPPELQGVLVKLLADRATLGVAARGLALFDDPELAPMLLRQFPQMNAEDQAALAGALAARPRSARALLDAVADGRVPRTLVTAHHARQMLSHGDEALSRRLGEVWGRIRSSDDDKRRLLARYQTVLTPERLRQADRSQGRQLFQQVCASCHRLFGEGAVIGPDLTGSGRGNLDYLLENIVDPSALVPADFRMSTLDLKDDRVLSGVVVAQTERTLTLQTPTERLALDRAEIAAMQESALSLMPEGLLEPLSDAQICDLIAYLMSPNPVPWPSPVATPAQSDRPQY